MQAFENSPNTVTEKGEDMIFDDTLKSASQTSRRNTDLGNIDLVSA